jgi:nucleoside-diphosphate-sugar epimerase
MRLLILGGTAFLGRALVDDALGRGHELTLFNRGKTNPELYPEVERLQGDRDGDLTVLQGKTWDAVIDTSGYVPRVVGQSAELLADAVGHYTFISSISAYADFSQPGADENAAVGKLEDESVEEIDGDTYGPLKVLCEEVVEKRLPGRTLIIRPGLIIGPHDPTDRFTYWPCRVERGGEVLAPGKPEKSVQFIDARDLAAWNLDMVEGGADPGLGRVTRNVQGSQLQRRATHPGRRGRSRRARSLRLDGIAAVDPRLGQYVGLPNAQDRQGPHSRHALQAPIRNRARHARLGFDSPGRPRVGRGAQSRARGRIVGGLERTA